MGERPTVAADSLQLQIQSGSAHDIALKAGAGKAVGTAGMDVVLNPRTSGNVVVGGTHPTIQAVDNRDLILLAGGEDRNIRLEPNGLGAVVIGGSLPPVMATNNTLTLRSPPNTTVDMSPNIVVSPAGAGAVIMEAKAGNGTDGSELTIIISYAVANNADIRLIPHGTGQVVIGGDNPIIRSTATRCG